MRYLKKIATDKSIWPKGTFFARVAVSDELYDEFIEWQAVHNPHVEYVEQFFMNKYHRVSVLSEYRQEWVKVNSRWKLII